MIGYLASLLGIGRATLVDDSKAVQQVQVTERSTGSVSDDWVTDNVQRITEYGFTSHLPDNSDVFVLRRGRRVAGVVIATSHKSSRPTDLAKGDVCFYDLRGHRITLTEDGIVINAAGDEVKVVNASKVRCECDIETTGDVIARVDGTRVSLNDLHDAYNLHTHPPQAGAGTWGSGPPNPKAE